MFFASVGALALGEFAEAAAVVFLFAISEWLEVRATSRARRALSAIVSLRPEKANLVHPTTHELIVVPAATVPVGALVSVKTGDKIPCDGVVVEGQSSVDESSLTGESRPIRKGPDDKVSGGTVNSGTTQLMVRTTSTAENSAVSRLIKLVEEAQANRSETEKLVDEFAKIYTPFVVLAAILMCTIPWAFGSDAGKEWTRNGLILIVVACPCALIISTPVSYVAGLAATAQRGVLIKGGANLEALGLVKNICFDKTGTLTNGEFALLHMDVFGEGLSRKEVFQYLSLMEERASHPLAQAILTGARNEGVTIPKTMKLQKHTIIPGEGVGGVVNGLEVHVGNERLFDRLGLLVGLADSDHKKVEAWASIGGTVGYMSVEGEGIVCAFCVADGVRPESAAVVKSLKKLGIDLTMLTGDNRDAAIAVGGQVGLAGDEIQAKLLPSDKLEFVQSLSADHVKRSALFNLCSPRQMVMMCGDGVNDAPALAAADIGVAMGAGAALAMETADVTLLDSNLEKLEFSIRMGRRVIAKIKQNVAFSIGVKFVVLGFALTGKTSLWAAIASDVGAMLLVTLNAMLLLPARQRENDVAMLKGDIEQASKDRPVMSREASDTESDDDVPSRKKVKSKESGCCSSDSCGGARKATQGHDSSHSKNSSSHKEDVNGHSGAQTGTRSHLDHSQAHANTGGHTHSHESHNDSHAQPASGCCSQKESTSQPHEHKPEHKHATGHDDSIAQTTSGCCSRNESTSLQHDHGRAQGQDNDDDPHAQHNSGSCLQKENSSAGLQEEH
jgi:Cd2+/Zn2+-exporting ATPase